MGKKVCGQCRGKLQFLGKFSQNGSPVKTRKPSAFSQYVKENFAAAKKECVPGTPASEIMKTLSSRWAAERQGGNDNGIVASERSVLSAFSNLNI